ncbi:MAG: hypothetical protein ACRDOI_25690 [Trebonia sp.]
MVTVADRATFADPHRPSAGVSEFPVNGKVRLVSSRVAGHTDLPHPAAFQQSGADHAGRVRASQIHDRYIRRSG